LANKKIDAGDTIDSATHYLHKLQSEGWTLQHLDHELEYAKSRNGGPKLLVASKVIIRLIPRW
jgi:hypothetical protein